MYDARDKKITKLTKGQQLKVNLAKLLINDPKIVFIDSPTSTMDNKNKLDFYNTVRDLCKKKD